MSRHYRRTRREPNVCLKKTDGLVGIQKEEHTEEQKDTERTEGQAFSDSQEKDDDDDLPDESPVKKKSQVKKKREGDQGVIASKTVPSVTVLKE